MVSAPRSEAIRVKKSGGAALKWMNSPSEHLCGRLPIEMTNTDQDAAELRAYMDKYAKEFKA
jgi:6-hydroxy-3-succinoylpyridine 3-monooxygenase